MTIDIKKTVLIVGCGPAYVRSASRHYLSRRGTGLMAQWFRGD